MESQNSITYNITPPDVYEELESREFVENIFNNLLADIKNSEPYTNLKEVALQHFSSIMAGENDCQPSSQLIEKKKKQTCNIGYLSDSIGSTITKVVSEKLQLLHDDIYAASKAVLEELQMKNSIIKTTRGCYNDTFEDSQLNRKSKRKHVDDSDSDVSISPSKRLSNRKKIPNSKYFSGEIQTATIDYNSSFC